MGIRSSAASNPILTNYAQGLMQDRTSAIAEFIAPSVIVPATIGHFKKYDDQNPFQSLDTSRAIGGQAKRVDFLASDPTYNCQPQALDIPIDDSERDAAGTEDPIILEQAKTSVLVNTAVLSHEDKVLTAVKAGVTATANRGNWSSNDIDPIDQIDEAIDTIAKAAGILPNRIVIGLGAWRILRGNTKVKNRLAGVKSSGFTLQDFAGALLNPSIEPRIGVLVKSSTRIPATKSTSYVVGDECFVFFANPAPSTYDPSFAKTFRGNRGGVQSVSVYRDPSNRSDILAMDWSVDVQVVATSVVQRLSVT